MSLLTLKRLRVPSMNALLKILIPQVTTNYLKQPYHLLRTRVNVKLGYNSTTQSVTCALFNYKLKGVRCVVDLSVSDCVLEEDGTVAGSEAAEALEQSRAAEVGITTKVSSARC